MRKILCLSLLLTVTLVACSPGTALPSPFINSVTSTAKIIPTSTHTAIPEPAATATSTATPWAFASATSPNGEYIANAYFEYQLPSGLPAIQILNKENKLIWEIPFQGEMSTSDPHRSLSIFQWASDSSKLYFHYIFSPDGGDRAFWWTGLDLQSFDVKTGEIQPVLPGEGFMSFAISPDGAKIAYVRSQDNPYIFYVRDLQTDLQKTAYVIFGSKNYARIGDIRWSPSGKEIAFQTETKDYMVQTILLNPVTLKQKLIREYKLFTLWFDGWTEDGKLQFAEASANGMRVDKVFQINVATFETVLIGTPTPRP